MGEGQKQVEVCGTGGRKGQKCEGTCTCTRTCTFLGVGDGRPALAKTKKWRRINSSRDWRGERGILEPRGASDNSMITTNLTVPFKLIETIPFDPIDSKFQEPEILSNVHSQ